MARKHPLARVFPGHRRPARPMPLMHVHPHMAVRGTDNGETYTDDFGATWTYEIQSGWPAGQVRARTRSYGGLTSPWYDRPVLGSGHDDVNAWIDVNAGVAHAAGKTVDDASSSSPGGDRPGAVKPISGGVTAPVKKAISDALGLGNGPTTITAKAPTPTSPWTVLAVLGPPVAGGFLAGPLGIGIGAAIGLGAYLVSKKAA